MNKLVLGAAAAATLIAAWFAPDSDGSVVGPAAATPRETARPAVTATPPSPEPASVAAPEGIDLQIHPRVADDELGNVFAKQSWHAQEAPLKVIPKEVQAAANQNNAPAGPPPLPIQFLGRFTDDGKTAYFLQIDGRDVVAHPGEKIDDNYQFDSVSNGSLHFTYLPLNQPQSLAVGDSN
jgi:hypothetical protein